tara:strand:+ start:965 stop:1231 length:267 start_codon:yes stop_codon:yes gene_type:complete
MGFGIDMAKAKEIHKNYIREARKPKLEALDLEFQRAIETDDSAKKSEVSAKKQALRDAPADSAINSASNALELKAQWNTSILGTSPYS